MTSRRLIEISASNWFEVGKELATRVSAKSLFAYKFDRDAYRDEPDIEQLWTKDLAPKAKKSMKKLTPFAYDLCDGFDSVLSGLEGGFSCWELLTLYEVDMFLHEFHFKCDLCKKRIIKGLRYMCNACLSAPESPKKKRAAEKDSSDKDRSICQSCYTDKSTCMKCSSPLDSTEILYETHGLGIANKSGCTGFGHAIASASVVCGQTLEMATDTYNYGRFDTIYKLTNSTTGVSVLVYDVGCILSPFGINSEGFGLCVFNLYNSDYSLPPYPPSDSRLPMAALQWEVLLRGSKHVNEAVHFLTKTASTFTSASFILASAVDRDTTVIEITANNHWVPDQRKDHPSDEDNQPPAVLVDQGLGSKVIVRANNCLAGSSVKPSESLPPNISSFKRQRNLFDSFRSNTGSVSVEWVKQALSTPTIQTDHCLGTIIMEPLELKMHVRFRVGTRISSTLTNGGKWETFHL